MNKETDKFLIIYHMEDNDGLVSMAIAYNYLTDMLGIKPENIHRLGADYEIMNQLSTKKIKGNKTKLDIVLETYQHIIMTDISFNDFKYIKKIYEALGKEFIWIDHHAPVIKQSVIEKCDGISGERNTQRSAILNAYRFFFDPFDQKHATKDKSIELFRILSAMDSFSYEREGYEKDYVFDVNTGVSNKFMLKPEKIIPFVHQVLFEMDTRTQNSYIVRFHEEGHNYNVVQDEKNSNIVKQYGEEWKLRDGRSCCVIFYAGQTSSLYFKDVADKYQNGVVFKHLANGTWNVSMYNTSEDDKFDCGNYMKEHYGGGGHPGAAGGQMTQEKFIEVLQNKVF